jgi:DNA-binding FadR family transcriptional regulator
MPRYGPAGRPEPESVPDWLLGGIARRLVLERLRDESGWSGQELSDTLGLSRPWVFEVLRVLRAVNAVEQVSRGRYRLSESEPVGRSLRDLLNAAASYAGVAVDRPPSRQ